MEVPHDAVLLRIFTSLDDRYGIEPLQTAILERARARHLAGATVLRGSLGFGRSARLRESHPLTFKDDRPVIIEIVDAEDRIEAFLVELDGMMESGLVTLERVRILQYGRKRSPYLKELFDRLGHYWRHDAPASGA
jgi:PII-like signaling protein